MAASLFDSAIYRDLLHDREVGALFTDSAEIRAMLLVEGALAKVQGAAGLIPEVSAAAIHRASLELQLDPGGLSAATGGNGVPVPALVTAFREAMQAPEHGQWVHFGATSQDIMDTALVLRLRQALTLCEGRLRVVLQGLGTLAEEHAALPMAGRTWGQVATPTSFGAVAASWGRPLLRLDGEVEALRHGLLSVSLSGAAGTLSAMGDKGPAIRAALAEALNLNDPGAGWHGERDRIAALSGWALRVLTALARIGEDLITLSRSEIGEVRLPGAGASSTMPQKQNPVAPSLLVALGRFAAGLDPVIQGAGLHRDQRDGTAWMAEWMALPQMILALGRALRVAEGLVSVLPVPARMAANLDDGRGLAFAEALQFRLARTLPRPEAQAAVKDLCRAVAEHGGSLRERAAKAYPDADLADVFDPARQLGQAPDEARAFAEAVRDLAQRPTGG